MVDWSAGRYETTAAELAPVSTRVIEQVAPARGEALLDVACGTGNALLEAARRGAAVTGVDAASRLLGVARERLEAEGLAGELIEADMSSLPLPSGGFDVVVSIFGLIFAADPAAAMAELARVLKPSARAFITAWIPRGPIDAMIGVFARAAAAGGAGGGPGSRARFPWHETTAVAQLAASAGLSASFEDATLEIRGPSPEAYLAATFEHPMALAMAPTVEAGSGRAATAAAALEVLREGNEDPDGFLVHSPYRIVSLIHA